ncbi:MAG: hypothetical protein QNJ97_11940 [Myxococcota bacterium]|nr:hypothetical protein [Myxococcota bacterium]
MSAKAKYVMGLTMTIALMFGFLDPIWPDAVVSFKRLHIFLFNLLTGGSLILYYTEGKGIFTVKVRAFFALALLYALFAAAGLYIPTLILSAPLFLIVESVRNSRFSFLPLDFFRPRVPVHEKFNQASLLCLSLGIVIASLVIINNEYAGWVQYEKLTIEVFFLGYSFPVSLITMALMFSFMTERSSRLIGVLKEIGFWSVNLGVIIFFVFIIFKWFAAEMVISITLFFTVFMIFFMFIITAPAVQQKTFLLSGMVFLLFTALTGIAYILAYPFPFLSEYKDFLLQLHAMVSLYGWNLSGLFIIIRYNDFPIRLNSFLAIFLHWAIVLVLAPLGKYDWPIAVAALGAYVGLLTVVFLGHAIQRSVRQ